jgi:RNA polymerase sigma-B factor
MSLPRRDEDRALFERCADPTDPLDRDALVVRFLPLARSIASRYAHAGEPFDDVFQVACVGLLKAIDRFDVAKDRAFSSFAVPTISGEIKRYFRDRTWSVHVPRDLQDRTLAVERASSELQTERSRAPTVSEIAERLGIEDEEVLEALHARRARRSDSLDAPLRLDDEDTTVGNVVAVREPGFDAAERRADLDGQLRVLTSRERLVLRLRFEHDLTQCEIGERIGVSQMQVSRILRASIERLRECSQDRPSENGTAVAA